jgi:glycosyltransferase involved in cell wall biosynthesis
MVNNTENSQESSANLVSAEKKPGDLISIIIACYNEESILEESILKIREILDNSKYPYEIVFVDDNSQDGTVDIIKKLIHGREDERALFHEKNLGRGRTVTDGIMASKGKFVGFIDIDLETEAFYIPPLILELEKGADIATAWRIYKIKLRSLHRLILSKGYISLVRLLLRIPLRDTETGCKFFNRESIIPVLQEIKDEHWFWDTEIMVRSLLMGLTIRELPTLYIRKYETGTTVKLLRDTLIYMKNLRWFYFEVKNLRSSKSSLKQGDKSS